MLGDHNLLMVNVHVAHDCRLGNHGIFANNVMLAGHVTIEDRAYVSGAVGVHQFYAAAPSISGPAQAMSDAQATTARISRHLAEMGVDPALWLHALDTPPQALYYFTPAELSEYRLVTEPAVTARRK